MFTGFDKWLDANGEDVRWATTVADAFAAAGGEGNMSDAVEQRAVAALQAAGVGATRQDIAIDPPQAYGHPPTTGYADDPVNTATGNFVETEVDLAFPGAAAELALARTYNSVDRRGRRVRARLVVVAEAGLELGRRGGAGWSCPTAGGSCSRGSATAGTGRPARTCG